MEVFSVEAQLIVLTRVRIVHRNVQLSVAAGGSNSSVSKRPSLPCQSRSRAAPTNARTRFLPRRRGPRAKGPLLELHTLPQSSGTSVDFFEVYTQSV